MKRKTTQAHQRSFEQAPRVPAGELVEFLYEDARNPGWFYGRAADGVAGYFPSRWFELDASAGQARAVRAYDAAELSLEAGIEVEILAQESGWLLARTADGRQGWIPACCCE